jgi:hypothetical protein
MWFAEPREKAFRPRPRNVTVGLIRRLTHFGAVGEQQMKHARQLIAGGTRTPRAKDGVLLPENFGLDEEIAEGGMRKIGARIQHHFGIARDLNGARFVRMIRERHATHLNVVFRRHADLGVGINLVQARAKLGAVLAENRFVSRGRLQRGLISRGPELSALQIAEIKERSPAIARRVFTPAGQRDVVPIAVAPTRTRDHDVITAVRQQVHFGRSGMRIFEDAEGHFIRHARFARSAGFQFVRVKDGNCFGHALVQQQFRGLEDWIRVKAPLHRAVKEQGRQRQQTHALVMRHEGLNEARFAARIREGVKSMAS